MVGETAVLAQPPDRRPLRNKRPEAGCRKGAVVCSLLKPLSSPCTKPKAIPAAFFPCAANKTDKKMWPGCAVTVLWPDALVGFLQGLLGGPRHQKLLGSTRPGSFSRHSKTPQLVSSTHRSVEGNGLERQGC